MKKLKKESKQTSSVIFCLLLIITLLIGYIMNFSRIGQPLLSTYGRDVGMLDMKLYYTRIEALKLFDILGAKGIKDYTRILFVDFIFIICLAFVMSFLMKKFLNKMEVPHKLEKIYLLAYIRAFFDLFENILLLISMKHLFLRNLFLSIAGVVTFFKWVTMGLYFLFILLILINKFVTGFKQIS
ncbi:TPA: hypothetical protein ACF3QW_001730 [Enterococcus faecium]